MDNFENILESILFVSGDAVDINDITSKLDVTKADIKNAVKKLKNKYKDDSGIILLEFNNKLQLASASKYSEDVSKVLNPIRQRNLSKATLETASIVAYKQPVTRLEIEEIRGVSSDYAINILLEHNLIEIVGRKDTVGKPVLFGTTDEFLKRFNISSISELPSYEELLEKVKVIKSADDRLYNHFEINESDEEMEAKLGLREDVALAKDEEYYVKNEQDGGFDKDESDTSYFNNGGTNSDESFDLGDEKERREEPNGEDEIQDDEDDDDFDDDLADDESDDPDDWDIL